MKNNNRLVTVLYIISRLSFRAFQLFLLFALIFECIPDGSLGSYNSNSHHSKGYQINTHIQLNIPDTLIFYNNKEARTAGSILKTGDKEFDKDFSEIKNDKKINKTYQINNFDVYSISDHDFNTKKEFNNVEPQNNFSDLSVIVNPKNYFLKGALLVKNYLSLVLGLFVSYQLMRLFKQLRTDFAFDQLLNKRIRNIGYSLVSFQIINMTISIITTQYLSTINYYHYIPTVENSKFQFMNLSTYVEYNWQTLFMGLCLVVLAKLLSYGYDLQNENELTI
ncbi:DUF2975 domain-containing protein [Flavobacterium reichenbachii]|uniref:DUF2975 domain-containing protein n=1 Tax=Flavobacterium reichenbachii TaxID=362418 RepID=A0A085ZT32_9FLAO|nr:DUF2975 domain-containing protein [Flavobacterium reichenbachii]KFF07596.1 hypothetical protein IW19_19725 [Flavobacterium reichenbachii]OXB14238.1 hypothetical protein B0A68_13525 [Flavobacterium reichenbachii]